jgi:hypothetical protein
MILAKDVPYYMNRHEQHDCQGTHFRNGEQVVFTVLGACAKYPICDFFVTIHVTLTVLVLSSLKTGKKLERYSRSYNAFGMAKLFWVCVGVTTDVVTKQTLVSLNKYTQCIT